ncbi:hypothetical protein KCU98_g192, partial [Aureobasidium melanogenum]
MACRLVAMPRTTKMDQASLLTLDHQLWWHSLAVNMIESCRHYPVLLMLLLLWSLVVCRSDTVVVMTSTSLEQWRRERGQRGCGSDEGAARSGGYERD